MGHGFEERGTQRRCTRTSWRVEYLLQILPNSLNVGEVLSIMLNAICGLVGV